MTAQSFRLSDIDGAFEVRAGFPRPDWNVIVEWAERLSNDVNRHELWTEIAAHWLSMGTSWMAPCAERVAA